MAPLMVTLAKTKSLYCTRYLAINCDLFIIIIINHTFFYREEAGRSVPGPEVRRRVANQRMVGVVRQQRLSVRQESRRQARPPGSNTQDVRVNRRQSVSIALGYIVIAVLCLWLCPAIAVFLFFLPSTCTRFS